MRLTEMIEILSLYKDEYGNIPVEISDGYKGLFYRGDFLIKAFQMKDKSFIVDIGIGGMDSEDES